MSRPDSVTSEIHRLYEETVRDSLASILHNAFGTCCRQPEDGFQRLFHKRDNLRNLWWSKKSNDSQVEIDFLAHVSPLSTLSDINTEKVSENTHVVVFKSTSQTAAGASVGVASCFQQTKSASPEKTDALPHGGDGDGDNEHFQYVVAEITCGGSESVLNKLEQLEKDCYFLCSRANPSLTSETDFQVLEAVAFVAVVSPKLKANELRNRILNISKPLPLLKELYNCGRFVWIEHTKTLGVVVRELGYKLETVDTKLFEQSQALSEQSQALSEQSQALETLNTKLSEQSQTIQALKDQMTQQFLAMQQLMLARLPERK